MIAGDATPCPGSSGEVYSVTNNPSATFYTWTLPSGATGASLTNSITVDYATSTGGDITVTASNGTCQSGAQTLAINMAGDNTWTGAVSTAWGLGGNWSCGTPPNQNSIVRIPDVANDPVVTSAMAMARKLTIESGATLTINGAGSKLTIFDSLVCQGTIMEGDGNGEFVFKGINRQDLFPGGNSVFPNVTIDVTKLIPDPAYISGLRLIDDSLVVAGNLRFVNGKLLLGPQNVRINEGGNIIGANPQRYIVTDHPKIDEDGFLVRHIPNGASLNVVYPIGLADQFTPSHVTKNDGSANYLKIRVFNGVFQNGFYDSGAVFTEKTLDRTWEVTPEIPTGHNLDINLDFRWKEAMHMANFFTSTAYGRRHKGGSSNTWEDLSSTTVTVDGNSLYTMTCQGVNSFSKFTIFSDDEPSLVNLYEFKGYNVDGNALLT